MVPQVPAAGDTPAQSRVVRKRREREQRFVGAARRIVADEGFDALRMQRLADDLDMAVSAVYRYFPSKGALVRQLQVEAIGQLSRSLRDVLRRVDEHPDLPDGDRPLMRLVLVGRWLCAASLAYPEDLRLLQMIMSQRNSTLDEGGGWKVLPVAMEVIGQAAQVVADAQAAGVVEPTDPIVRALMWASALGGVLQTDDLEQYAPDLFGQTRLAQQANLDLLRGWGAPPDGLARANALVDDLAATGPLAP